MKMRLLILVGLMIVAAVAAQADILVVAVGGESAPGGNGIFFDFDIPSLNRFGQVVFVATLGGTSGGVNDNAGIFAGTGAQDSLVPIVRKSNPSPDGNGNFLTLDARSAPVVNDAGHVAFIAGLSGTFGGGSDETGIFRSQGTAGALGVIVRQGQPVSGGLSLPNFRGGGLSPFSFNESEQVAFNVVGIGVFRSSGGALTEIARSLQPVPGGAGIFTTLSVPALNDAGQVAFADVLQGIFRGDGSTPVSIARLGDGSPDGNGSFAAPFFDPAINNRGEVAFFANLSGTSGSASDNQGFFIGDGESVTTIARKGQLAPDGNGRFLSLDTIDDIAINEAGQAAFLATLTNTRGGPSDNVGLFRSDGTTLTQIVRIGHRAPDGTVITGLSRPALNDAGQVAFLAELAAAGGGPTPHAIFLHDDQMGLFEAVRTGAPLLGTRIAINSTLIFQPSGTYNGKKRGALNERGQIAFRFDLDDGRRGIAIANPFSNTPTPTATPTPIQPAPTQSPTPSPTRMLGSCVGDCDDNGKVSIDELVHGVRIALGTETVASCSVFDCHGNDQVTVECLVAAVDGAIRGCNAPR